MADRLKVGILGATGSVGQRFLVLLQNHPYFEVAALGASSRSAGQAYAKAAHWKQSTPLPATAGTLEVVECRAEHFRECAVVFSGLDSSVAGEVEREFVDAGLHVISNARNYRMDPAVPLVVPTANPEHLDSLAFRDKTKGIHVCISNCSTAGLVVPLRALQDRFGPISHMVVTTLQAISGAGFSPGVGGMDIIDNIVPYIGSEEDKLETEPRKILGKVGANGHFEEIPADDFRISATTTRVPVIDGHTEAVALKFRDGKPALEDVKKALAEYTSQSQALACHSAPAQPIVYLEQDDRPQPRLDRDTGNGYTVSVGRLRDDAVLDLKFVCLSHNTVLGAAGSGILIAELLHAKKLL